MCSPYFGARRWAWLLKGPNWSLDIAEENIKPWEHHSTWICHAVLEPDGHCIPWTSSLSIQRSGSRSQPSCATVEELLRFLSKTAQSIAEAEVDLKWKASWTIFRELLNSSITTNMKAKTCSATKKQSYDGTRRWRTWIWLVLMSFVYQPWEPDTRQSVQYIAAHGGSICF